MAGIKRMWSLQAGSGGAGPGSGDKFLVLAYIGETRVLAIDGNEMAEAEVPGFAADESSIWVGNVAGGALVQVTSRSVRLVDATTLALLDELQAPAQITVASAHGGEIVLGLSGGEAWSVDVAPRRLARRGQLTLDHDIACVSLKSISWSPAETTGKLDNNMSVDMTPLDNVNLLVSSSAAGSGDAMNEASVNSATVVAMGMWTDNSLRLCSYPDLRELCRTPVGSEAQIRDVIIVELASVTYVFAGLGDGTLVYFELRFDGEHFNFEKRKFLVLGTRAVYLTPFTSASTGLPCLFASGDRPCVVYSHSGKLLFSAINAVEVTSMTPFHSASFPHCMALASDDGLLVGTIDEIQKVHIQEFPLGKSPIRLAFLKEHRVFAGKIISSLMISGHG